MRGELGDLGGDNNDGNGADPTTTITGLPENASVNTLNALRTHRTSNKISKKEKRANQVSWKKRRRQAEAVERAENLKEMLGKKVENSLSKLKGTTERKKPWDEYNRRVVKPLLHGVAGGKKKSNNLFDLLDNDVDNTAESKEAMDISD